MGFFSNYYTKPGPGISKDEPKKKGAALYFQLFFRHIWDFVKENMMYVVASIPAFLIYYYLFSVFDIFSIYEYFAKNNAVDIYETVKIFAVLLVVILCGTGPASAAMAYMMRCVTREEHCFLLSDFKDKFKENFKNGMILSVADILLISFIFPVALRFYHTSYVSSGSIGFSVLFVIIILFMLVYVMMHFYFYQFIITYELKLLNALKNSVIMALAYLPLNLLVMAVPVVLTYFLMSFIQPGVVILCAVFFWISFMRYPIEFLAARTIKNKLLDNNN